MSGRLSDECIGEAMVSEAREGVVGQTACTVDIFLSRCWDGR